MSSGIVQEVAKVIASGGGGILAVVLAVYLGIKAVDLGRTALARRNGHGTPKLSELRMVCPIATGRRTLDDLHEVLVELVGGVDRLNDQQGDGETATRNLTAVISELRIEIAKSNGRR